MLVTLEQAKAQLGITLDDDDEMITAKIAAAEAYLESQLGFSIAERYPEEPPAPLAEAVIQLVAHWFENREAAGDSMRQIPFGFAEIIDSYRDWSF